MKTTHLRFTGHSDAPVPHEFIRQDGEADRLAIFLPGFAYTCDMPLFYYAEVLLLAEGADLLRLQPSYVTEPGFLDLPHDEVVERIVGDAAPMVRAAMAERPYRDVIVIAKSLGTLTLAHLVADGIIPPSARLVWAPPLLNRDSVVAAISSHSGPSLLVIGTLDLEHDRIQLETLGIPAHVDVAILDGADHSLDIPDDVRASIGALATVVDRIGEVVGCRAPELGADDRLTSSVA